MVEKGAFAPDFTLSSDQGEQISLLGLRGKRVLLFGKSDHAAGFRVHGQAFCPGVTFA